MGLRRVRQSHSVRYTALLSPQTANGIKSPCSAALSRKLLRLKSVFLEARYCINLWWEKKRTEGRVSVLSVTALWQYHVHTETSGCILHKVRTSFVVYRRFGETARLLNQNENNIAGHFVFLVNCSCLCQGLTKVAQTPIKSSVLFMLKLKPLTQKGLWCHTCIQI